MNIDTDEKGLLTLLIQLKGGVLGTKLVQEILAGLAVGAVGLGEDNNAVLVDEVLSGDLSGRHDG